MSPAQTRRVELGCGRGASMGERTPEVGPACVDHSSRESLRTRSGPLTRSSAMVSNANHVPS